MNIKSKTADATAVSAEMTSAHHVVADSTMNKVKATLNLEKLKEGISLVDIIKTSGVDLQRNGNTLRGKCPLHNGDNPTSLAIYEDSQSWFCYRCDEGGDVIDFMQAWRNLDFADSLRYLADSAGISLEQIGFSKENAAQAKKRKKRSHLFQEAALFFAEELWSSRGKQARVYLKKRGFNAESIRLAGWGYAESTTALHQSLKKKGFDLALAKKIGLLRRDGQDFTANAKGKAASPDGYIIMPHQRAGKTNYFSARALAPKDPKDKSRNLPGKRQVYWAETKEREKLIIVEGQMDAESLRHLGFSALALCGVGKIPKGDLKRVLRYKKTYLALDNDLFEEGVSAQKKATIEKSQKKTQAKLAKMMGPLLMLFPVLAFKDFNAALQDGLKAEELFELLSKASPWIDQLLEDARSADPQDLTQIQDDIFASFQHLPEGLKLSYQKKMSKALGLGKEELKKALGMVEREIPISYSEIKKGVLYFQNEALGNFHARITKELILDDGLNQPQVRFTLEGQLGSGEKLNTIEVDSEEFLSLNFLNKLWGARPILYIPYGKRHLFLRAVQEVSLKDMKRERVYTCTGWAKVDGERSFLTASGGISAKGFDKNMRVELDDNLSHYTLPEPPQGKERYEAIRASLAFLDLAPLRVSAPIWAAMYASLLTEVLPLYTVLWVYGATQSGKSTIAHLALTHFGKGFIEGRQYHAPTDWMSTATHLEEAMFSAKDIPLIVDDFAPQFQGKEDATRIRATANRVVRSMGNRSARGRSKNYQAKTLAPRGLVLSTAELPLSGESTVGRMLYIPIERGDFLPDAGEKSRPMLDLAQEQAQSGMYALAMSAYIQWLAINWERAIKILAKFQAESLQKIRERSEMQNRLPDYFVVLDASQKLALRAFVEIGILGKEEEKVLSEEISEALANVVAMQVEKIAKESPVRKFFEALESLLTRHKVYLASRTKDFRHIQPPKAEMIGWHNPDENIVYLDDGACLELVRNYWAGQGEYFDTTTDALRRQMGQLPDLLAERGKGYNLLVSKWIAGKSRRALAINQERVQELYGVTLRNEER
ncbi:MAG: DUF927 domain-containing protein [Anaerolineae bacterium]|nr:DUF927 domain-containing protein [Anaerolineae bacterium]